MSKTKPKFTKYQVTIRREVEHVAVVEVEARTVEEAKQTAESVVDGAHANYWREGDVVSQTSKVKVLGG